jgi:hypothetical protein
MALLEQRKSIMLFLRSGYYSNILGDGHRFRNSKFFSQKAMLKLIVDFGTLLIGVEGAKTPAGGRGRGDPAGAQRRGGSPDRPRKAKRLERKSTGKFNIANQKKRCTSSDSHIFKSFIKEVRLCQNPVLQIY